MVRKSLRTKSKIKKFTKTPSNKNVIHYRNKSPKTAKCALCGLKLSGVSKETKNKSKSKKTVYRAYGGHICTKCYTKKIKDEVRAKTV